MTEERKTAFQSKINNCNNPAITFHYDLYWETIWPEHTSKYHLQVGPQILSGHHIES
jgi:hypothetical protein